MGEKMDKIKLVIFDLDNTLVNFNLCEEYALRYVSNKIGIDFSLEMINDFSVIDRELWKKGSYGLIEISKNDIPTRRFEILFNKHNINILDLNNVNDLYMEGFSNAIFPFDDSEEVLEYLTSKGYKIVVATNGLIKLQCPRIINSKLSKYIKQIFTSEEVGASKPNPIIFNKILEYNNFNNYEAIVIGDSLYNDIQGALNANIKSIWFNHLGVKNNNNIKPNYTLYNILDIKSIL